MTQFSNKDVYYMERALEIAKIAEGRTSPNPIVGCLIVKNGLIVGEGYHAKAGEPHAEVNALKAAGEKSEGADVYVTLEPCSHYGKTPPCCDALIEAKVKRVVVAMTDPNPLVSGQGIKKLIEAGITVETGLLEEKAKKLNEHFIKAITTKLPFVLYKTAMTLDGKTASETGDSRWISNARSRRYVHGLRNKYDVIMVGSKTVIADDPLLTCRLENGRNPVKLIVDGTLSISEKAKALSSSPDSQCIIATTLTAPKEKLNKLAKMDKVEIWQYQTERHVPLRDLLKDIYQKGWNSILLEGGGTLAGVMLQNKLIDKVEFFISPKLIGGNGPSPLSGLHLNKISDSYKLLNVEFSDFDGDIKIAGYIDYKKNNL